MKNNLGVFMLLCGLSSVALGLQVKPVLDDRKVIASIGADVLNRISVAGDRIAQVFGLEDEFFMETDENSGQVFIRPKQKKIINLTIITEKHITVDLQLIAEDIQAEAIILKTKPAGEVAETNFVNTDHDNKISTLILSMAKNKSLAGFSENATDKEIVMWDHIKILQIKEYIGKEFVGEVYSITNSTKQGICMTEIQFGLEKGVAGVALKKHILEAGETTALYIVREYV